MPKLDASALDYAALGYSVFPCGNNKRPLTAHGLKDATTDTDQIDRWGKMYPACNWGVLPPKDVLVLDCDTADAAQALEQAYGLFNCPKGCTPRGGAHFYLQLFEDAPHIPTKTKALPDVDIRGMSRAYLLAPPSCTSNGAYSWDRPLVAPENLPKVPQELLEKLTPKKRATEKRFKPPPTFAKGKDTGHLAYVQTALQREHDHVAAAPEGQRNDALNRAAFVLGQLVGSGALERGEVEKALSAAAATCGLPDGEAACTIKSGLEAGMQEPREIPTAKAARRPCTYRAGVYARLREWR